MNKPECFGTWWEAIPGPAGKNCRQCILKDECLAEFATTRLPAVQQQWTGAGDPLAFLAEQLEVDEQAVLMAMAYQKGEVMKQQTPVVPEPKWDGDELDINLSGVGMSSHSLDDAEPAPPPAKKKKAKRKTKKKRTWGDHTHEKRWLRERERNPLIAQLTPGTKLKAKFKGKGVTAMVKKGGYTHRGQTFPTLSALTLHIAGVSRSSVKFWKLEG